MGPLVTVGLEFDLNLFTDASTGSKNSSTKEEEDKSIDMRALSMLYLHCTVKETEP